MHVVCPNYVAHTHTERNTVTLFLEDFTFLYPGNREKGVEGDTCYSLEPLPSLRADEKLE